MAVVDANTVGEIPAGDTPATPPADEQPSGLPSDNADEQQSPWERAKADGYLPEDFKEDPYELAKSWKNGQEFVEKANAEKANAGHAAKDAATQAELQKNIMSLVPEFMKNGMELSDEMLVQAKEWGLDERDVKIAAYDYRDNITAAYDLVGGEETYASMMTEMSEIMSDDEKKAFNADLGSKASKYAIKGLHAEWQSKLHSGDVKPQGRIEGKVGGSGGVKPYTDQGEMLNDLRYLKTKGKADKAARQKYEARKAVTSDKIIMGG